MLVCLQFGRLLALIGVLVDVCHRSFWQLTTLRSPVVEATNDKELAASKDTYSYPSHPGRSAVQTPNQCLESTGSGNKLTGCFHTAKTHQRGKTERKGRPR